MVVELLLIFSWLFNKEFNPFTGGTQTRMIWLFILLLAIYIPFATNNYFAYQQARTILEYMPFFLSAILYINSFERLRRFFYFWMLLTIYIAINGILHRGVGGSSFLSDENDFSLLMNMMFPFGFFLFLYEKDIKKKLIYLTAVILPVISVVASFSRGGFVGLISVFTTIWIFSKQKIRTLVIIALAAIAIYAFSDQQYWTRIETSTKTNEGTAKERIDSWKAAWEMFKDYPLGVGGSNFPVHFQEYQGEKFRKGMWGRAAHSLWFTLLSELGIFGVIIYSLLLFYNLKDLFWLKQFNIHVDDDLRYASYLSMAFFASLVGYFSSGTFLSVLYYPHYFYMTAMIIAARKISEERIESFASLPDISPALTPLKEAGHGFDAV
ncbi:MAG: O-antigen ligase family protein [Nitrospiria bacterium]